MCVVPASGFGINRPLFEERAPSRVPVVEQCCKLLFRATGKRQGDFPQFLTRFKLRLHGQIPRHDLDLVEMAHLDGNTRKRFAYAFSAVNDERLDDESLLREMHDALLIYRRRFRHDDLPIQVLAFVRIPHDDDAPASAEEHGIRDHDDGTRHRDMRRNGVCVQLHPYPFLAPVISSGKLFNGAVVVGILMPQYSAKGIRTPLVFKLPPAGAASVALLAAEGSVFLRLAATA